MVSVRRLGALLVATAVVVAACSSDGGDSADDTTRNVTLTTKPLKPPVTTTLPPSPNTTGVGVGRNIPATTTMADRLRGTTSADLSCWILEVQGDLSRPQVSIPYNEVLPGQSPGLGLATSCDDTVFDPAANDGRIFLLPIGVPTINAVEQVGRTVLEANQRRALAADMRVVIDPPEITEVLRRNNVARLSYEYELQLDASVPAAAASALSGQMTSGTPHSGRFRVSDGDECFMLRVRVAEDRSRVSSTGVVRARSEWSDRETVCMNPPDDSPFVLIAFGDSYGSGEGNPTRPLTEFGRGCAGFWFYEQACVNRRPFESPELFAYHELGVDETVWGTSLQCHRSSQSGVAKAVDIIREQWNIQNMYFGHFACSGAVSANILDTNYVPDFDGSWFSEPSYPCEWAWKGRDGSCTAMPPQIDIAKYWLERQELTPTEVDAVVVSIGGNDAGFATLIAGCFIAPAVTCSDELFRDGTALTQAYDAMADFSHGFFSEIGPLWRRAEAMNDLRNALLNVAARMRREFPHADVYFTTYTDGLSVPRTDPADRDRDGVCSSADKTSRSEYRDDWMWDISPGEARWLQATMNEINRTIRDTVNGLRRTNRRVFVVDQQSAATGHGFCMGAARRNLEFPAEAVRKQTGDISEVLGLSSGGWHPNDLGYRLYGEAIAAAVQQSTPFLTTYPMWATQ